MEDYIYINSKSISSDLCDEIINTFENESNKHPGQTLGGIQKDVKDTTNFVIPTNCEKWYDIHQNLLISLTENIEKYLDNLSYAQKTNTKNYFKPIDKNDVIFHYFMVQKYDKNVGKHICHNDFNINFEKKEYRVITYLWYLNDVEEGGETCFWNNYNIKPEKGKLILFPASWAFPHCGNIPISNEKYIITGWLYSKNW